MKAFVVERYKSKSAVRLGEMPEPEVRDDDVLVQVHAASLNQLDSKIRDGEFKLILPRSEEHTSELQSLAYLVCRLLLEKKKKNISNYVPVRIRSRAYTDSSLVL